MSGRRARKPRPHGSESLPGNGLTAAVILLALACGAASPASIAADTPPTGPVSPTPWQSAEPDTAPAAEPAIEVRYLANEGFLIEAGGRRVLVDGLFGEGLDGYPAVPAAMRAELERGLGEWAGIEVALATHFHGDHFDPAAVGRFLEANPQAVFVSTPQAIARLNAALATQGAVSGTSRLALLTRIRQPFPEEGAVQTLEIDGIRIEALNLHHGRRTPPVENLGFVVTLAGKRFLHFGDTEAKLEDFEPYLDLLAEVDLAILPFWFLSSEWRAEMVRERIRPQAIVVGHLPSPSAPASYFGRWRSHDELVRLIAASFPSARIPRATGDAFAFAPDS